MPDFFAARWGMNAEGPQVQQHDPDVTRRVGGPACNSALS